MTASSCALSVPKIAPVSTASIIKLLTHIWFRRKLCPKLNLAQESSKSNAAARKVTAERTIANAIVQNVHVVQPATVPSAKTKSKKRDGKGGRGSIYRFQIGTKIIFCLNDNLKIFILNFIPTIINENRRQNTHL